MSSSVVDYKENYIMESEIDLLNKLNEDVENKDIIGSIDRPIRDLVVHMHRIGLRTAFSCCGFSYPDEEEPKSHAIESFVIFQEPQTPEENRAFFDFTRMSVESGWRVSKYGPRQWDIRYRPEKTSEEFYQKPGIHDFELKAIAIHCLVEKLKTYPTLYDNILIIDGNRWYQDNNVYWHVKPKMSSRINFRGSLTNKEEA